MGVESFVGLGGSVRVFVSGLPGMIVGDVEGMWGGVSRTEVGKGGVGVCELLIGIGIGRMPGEVKKGAGEGRGWGRRIAEAWVV